MLAFAQNREECFYFGSNITNVAEFDAADGCRVWIDLTLVNTSLKGIKYLELDFSNQI